MSSVNGYKKYDFTGKVALVTGSSSGIGAAIAIQLAQYGAQVCITGRDAANLAKIGAQIESETSNKPLQVLGDLLDESFPSRLVQQTVDHFGRLDILVNNAGGGHPNGKFLNENMMEGFDKVLGLNLRAAVQSIYAAIPHLEKTKGNIINIGSIGSIRPYLMAYSAAKAALDMVTKCGAMELGPKGIRVNSINTGPVYSAIGRSVNNENLMNEFEKLVKVRAPLGRVGEPVEIANFASFLASEDASFITGSINIADGGLLVEMINRKY